MKTVTITYQLVCRGKQSCIIHKKYSGLLSPSIHQKVPLSLFVHVLNDDKDDNAGNVMMLRKEQID